MPGDLIVLNWWYDPKVRYDQVDVFAASGLPQIVCPGTNSWNSVFPRVNMGWTNVANFTRDGRDVGAVGMLNTDWGDGGHYNLLGCSYYSYAHGADAAWAATPLPRADFEAVLAPVLFGTGSEEVVASISALGKVCDHPGNGGLTRDLLFFSPLELRICATCRVRCRTSYTPWPSPPVRIFTAWARQPGTLRAGGHGLGRGCYRLCRTEEHPTS